MFLVFGGIQQGNRPCSEGLTDRLDEFLVALDFLQIPIAKLFPFEGIVSEPLAKGPTRGDFLDPPGKGKGFLFNAAWPESVD